MTEYQKFLQSKVIISEDFGFDVNENQLTPLLKPHQKDICLWSLKGGRRAISVELNTEYFQDGCFYVNAKNYALNVPTLFDLV